MTTNTPIAGTEAGDRYRQAIAASSVPVDESTVKAAVEKILDGAAAYANADTYKFLLNSIDLTTLNTEDSVRSVGAFVRKVNDFDSEYPQYGNVAAICVYSNFAETVDAELDAQGVKIATVAGGFPTSQTFTAVKVADVALAVAGGAEEIDVVMNLGMLRDANYEDLTDELIEMRHTAKGALMKVILETGALRTLAAIREASVLALYSEADFLKTSTGKGYPGASPEAAWVMCSCIKEYYKATGRKVGFKASGGIRTVADALVYYAIVKEVLGDEWLDPRYFRIGASSLANAVLSALEEEEVNYF